MVNVFYSPPGYRNTTECLFKKALELFKNNVACPDYSRILYLAPTSTKVTEAHKIFHKLVSPVVRHCYIPPDMATIEQFSQKIYSTNGSRRIVQHSLVPLIISRLSGRGIGFSSLLTAFISDLKKRYIDKDIDKIRGIFIDVFSELNIPESVAKPAFDCMDIFNNYKVFLEENGLIDRDDIVNACPEYIPEIPFTLIIDGFYDLTPNEKKVLMSLIQNSGLTLVALPYEPSFRELTDDYISFLRESPDLKEIFIEQSAASIVTDSRTSNDKRFAYNSYPDPEGEVEGIARNIKSLYVSGRFKKLEEIVVAFPNLNRYFFTIERVFTRYGIPFDISKKEPLGKTRQFLDLICLLTSVAEDYPRLKFSQFLSSIYFRNIPDSLKTQIPLLSIQSGIISGKESWLNLSSKGSETIDIKGTTIKEDLGLVFDKLKPLEDIRCSATFETYLDVLKKVLDELGFLETAILPSEPIGKAEFQIAVRDKRKALNEILEQISFLGSLYQNNISLFEFVEILCHLLNASFAKEEWQGVRVMELFDVMWLSPEYLYIGGLTDDAVPRRQEIDYILPDNVKRKLGLLYLDRYLDMQRFMFTYIVNSSKHLHLSYPLMEGEDMYLPSSYLYAGEEVRERIAGVFSKEEYLIMNGKTPFSSCISEIQIKPLTAGFQQYIKVTDIDAYRTCPRRFFIEKVLGLRPSEIKEYELEAITIGNIMHKIMEKIIKEPMEDLDYLKNRTADIIDEIVAGQKIEDYWKQLIRDTFIEILPDIYEKEKEIRKEDYIISEVEKPISGEPLKGIKLRGKIDRFDKIGDSIQIIDYKTGTTRLNCSQVAKGKESLQLFLYAAMMKSHGYRVKRVGIYSLKDIAVKWCPPPKKSKGQGAGGKDTLDDYIVASLQFLEDTVKNMRNGDFRAQPLNEFNCRNCHEFSLCPFIQQH